MTVDLPPDLEERINQEIASGAFASAEKVIRDALLRRRDEKERQQALADIRAGIADKEAGRVRPLEEVTTEIERVRGWASE